MTELFEYAKGEMMTNIYSEKMRALLVAVQGLGSMPGGYCFCSTDRVGDDSKVHQPECRDLRTAIHEAMLIEPSHLAVVASTDLARALCHAPESGLLSDPETADTVATFITDHYRVIRRD